MEINLCMGCMRKWEGTGACPHCGFDLSGYRPSSHHLPPGTVLAGKYLVGRSIGEGGFGITYIGWDLNLEMRVAVKEYFPEGFVTRRASESASVRISGQQGAEYYRQGREKFLKEARALARLDNTPGIVRIKDYFQENETVYLVMEYLDGITLKRYVEQMGGKIPGEQALRMAYPLMEALDKAHEAGILHRDISPDNIMVLGDGRVKLMDFGSAKDLENDGSRQSKAMMLKPGYAPPEQYRVNALQGPWTDVYALCATIYYCVTGSTVPQSIDRMMSGAETPLPEELGAVITPGQSQALMKGLSLDAGERFQTMGQLFESLSRAPGPENQADPGRSGGPEAPSGASAARSVEDGWSKNAVRTAGGPGSRFKRGLVIMALAVLAVVLFGLQQDTGRGKPMDGGTGRGPSAAPDGRGMEGGTGETGGSGMDAGHGLSIGTPGSVPSGREKPDRKAFSPLNNTWTEEELRDMKEYGSLPANIANGGKFIVRQSVIYGSDSNGGLMRVAEDSRGRIARCGSSMNLIDGRLYYWNPQDRGIYAADEDRALDRAGAGEAYESIRVGDAQSSGCVSVVDDWIYYLDQKGRPGRMRTDGTGLKRLGDHSCGQLQVWDGWLYYIDHENDKKVCRMRPDGSGTEELTSQKTDCFAVEDGIIYGSDGSGIWKKDTKSMEFTPLSLHPAAALNVWKGVVFSVDQKDGLIYRVEPDGSRKALSDTPVLPAICVYGDSLYCIRKTGSACGQAYLYSTEGNGGLVFTVSAGEQGNTNSNCVNYGALVGDAYGACHGMMADGNLYRNIRRDRPDALAYQSWELNTDLEYAYYVVEENDREASICRRPLDGSGGAEELLKLTSSKGDLAVRYLSLTDGMLYYGWKQGDVVHPYRLDPDTGKNERISDENCWSMNVYEGWIYYLDGEQGIPYRMRLDGSECVRLYGQPARALVLDESVMYLALDDAVVKMWPDGSSAETVAWVQASFLNVCGGWIFYGDRGDGDKLYRLSTDGTVRDLICSEGVKWVNAVPAVDSICLVYYWDTEDNKPYLCLPDGSGWVALEVNGG